MCLLTAVIQGSTDKQSQAGGHLTNTYLLTRLAGSRGGGGRSTVYMYIHIYIIYTIAMNRLKIKIIKKTQIN